MREYLPDGQATGMLLFSVGYGGQASGYGYLARHWAESGLATFVIEHVGSNLEVLKSFAHLSKDARNEEVVRRVQDPEELRLRPHDVELVYRNVAPHFEGLPWGLGGHSYGTYSALSSIGLKPHQVDPKMTPLKPHSLVLISPQPPGLLFRDEDYAEVTIPCLVLTGTQDDLVSGASSYEDRLKVYDCLPAVRRHLVVQEGTDHMAFAGIGLKLESHLKTTQSVTTQWWKRSLFGENSKESWCALLHDALPSERIHLCQ